MLKRILVRLLLYPIAIIVGAVAMMLIIAALPWLPAAFFLAFVGLGLLSAIVMIFVCLDRVFWWV